MKKEIKEGETNISTYLFPHTASTPIMTWQKVIWKNVKYFHEVQSNLQIWQAQFSRKITKKKKR
jgi:hypothetical protein